MAFNAQEHVIQLKNKQGSSDYLPVQWRLAWVNDDCKTEQFQKLAITIVKSVIDLDRSITKEIYAWNNETRRSEKVQKTDTGYAYYEMRVEIVDKGGNVKIGEGSKSECAVDFPDYAEKAQTGAIGRALASIGYGTQFAPELNEEHRIVDSPVDAGNGHKSTSVTRSQPQQTDQDVKKSVHAQNRETNQDNRPGGSTTVVERMTEQAKGRAQKLGIAWDRVKGDSLGEQIPDEKLIPNHFTKINGYLAKKERGEAAA